MNISEIITSIDDVLYTWCLIYVLAGAGIFFTIRTGFVQFRLFKDALSCMNEKKQTDKGVSAFQALMIATASRVGTGNMAGVATAIVIGGPGSAFWMWLMAILGSASAFAESTLAQIYKKRDGDSFKGGPAYYIEKALNARWLGVLFAISLIATFAFGFNGLQAFNIVSTFQYYVADFEHSSVPIVVGIILFIVSIILFFGGTEKIGWVSSILVPLMAGLYIILGLLIIVFNIGQMPAVFASIMKSAFDFKAIFGGFTGSCMVYGIKRGLFSNEAGMGSAPNASASAEVTHPVKQGLAQIISVYIDTLLICSTTVFILLLTGVYKEDSSLSGIPLLQQSVAKQFGPAAIHAVTVAVILFAFTSIIGNYFYAEANIRFISKSPVFMTVFRIAAAAMVFFGAQNNIEVAWSLADITMGIEAIINIVVIIMLSGIVISALRDYEKQKAEGRDPVFHEKSIGLDNTDVWK
jgi:AGCS family alanine or glycine:cation symporter